MSQFGEEEEMFPNSPDTPRPTSPQADSTDGLIDPQDTTITPAGQHMSCPGENTQRDNLITPAGQHTSCPGENTHRDNLTLQTQELTYGELTEYTVFTPINPENSPKSYRSKAGNTANTSHTTAPIPQNTQEEPSREYCPLAENTAPTPVDHAGTYQGEYTPRRSLTSNEAHMDPTRAIATSSTDPEAMTSSATSTPGSTPMNPKES